MHKYSTPWKMSVRILILIFTCVHWSKAAFQIPDALADGVKGNPGMQTCIRKRMLPLISRILGRFVDEEIEKINPPDTSVKLPLVTKGSVTLKKMKFLNFKSASNHSISFSPPNEMEWVSDNLHFNISGQFGTTSQQLFSSAQTSGAILLSAKNARVILRTRIRVGKKGVQKLELISCKANFANTTVITQASGFFGGLFKWFQSVLTASSHVLLERVTCETAKFYLESILNDMFSNGIPIHTPISLNPDSNLSKIPADLNLNYGLLRDPKVYGNCLAMQEIGEITSSNNTDTPFDAGRLNFSTKLTNDHMLDMWISDYLINSMLYHANELALFDVILNENTLIWTDRLQSQCAQNQNFECLGLVLPEISNPSDFPKQMVEIQLKPSNSTSAPFVLFQEDQPTALVADLIIDLYMIDAKGDRKNVITADARMHSAMHRLKITPDAFSAELSKSNITLKIKDDQLFLPPSSHAARALTLAPFVAELIQNLINTKLSPGVPMPKISGMKLVKTEAVLLKRTMNVAADVELDSKFWIEKASEARLRVSKNT